MDEPAGPPGCDNPQRLPTIRDAGLIGTPDAIVTRSRGRRRNRNRFVFKPSSRLIPRTILRVSPFSQPGSLLRPVPCAVRSADRVFIRLFSPSTLQTSIATLSVRGYVSSPSRKLALQRFGLLCGKLVKSFNSWACGLQKVTHTLASPLFPSTIHPRPLQHHHHEQSTSNRRWHRGREHRRGEETSKSPQTASTAQQS